MSDAIRNARQNAGMTQKEVAQALNKAQTTITAWETGRAQPDASTIAELSRLFNVSSDYLLGLRRFSSEGVEGVIKDIFGDTLEKQPERNIRELSEILEEIKVSFFELNKISPDLIPRACDVIFSSVSAVSVMVDCYLDNFYVDFGNKTVNKMKELSPETFSTLMKQERLDYSSVEEVKEDLIRIMRIAQVHAFSTSVATLIKNRKNNERMLQLLAESLKNMMLENTLKDMNDVRNGGTEASAD